MDNTVCERAEDLISFLYGELSEADAGRFERHLRQCDECELEFKEFGQIRTSIGEWRNESLGARSPAFSEQPLLAPANARVGLQPKRSAVAALREFFALSPPWMRGAVALAMVTFCMCAALAVAYLKSHEPHIVRVSPDKPSSQQQIDKQVAAEVQKRLNDLQMPKQNESDRQTAQNQPAPRRVINHSSIPRRSETARASRPFTPRERQELAADLRIITSTGDEEELDLTGDSNRPRP